MLARIAHELYWIGRQLSRAEHTARMLDGLFHADLEGRADDAVIGIRLTWDHVLAIMGHGADGAQNRDEVMHLLTLDRDNASSIVACVAAAREGARVVRDVCSAEMWEAINAFHLDMQRRVGRDLRAGPHSVYSFVKERCGLFWGLTERTMLRDEAHAFLEAGGRIEAADMVLRMLRVAYPTGAGVDEDVDRVWRSGQALALLHAVGGTQAFRRAVAGPPHAMPVARFLLFEHAYPDSVAASVGRLHTALQEADAAPRSSPPVLRITRLLADMDFRRRSPAADAELPGTFTFVQEELAACDADIALRYFGGASTTPHTAPS